MGDNNWRIQVVIHRLVALFPYIFHLNGRCCGWFQLLQTCISVQQSRHSFLCSLQSFVAKVHCAAIMRLQNKETDCHGRIRLLQFLMRTSKELI